MAEKTIHYLFICSANRNRSKAAERICRQLAREKGRQIDCQSAGVDPLAERRPTKQMTDRADIIFVMEEYMKHIIENEFHQPAGKIICFDIPDVYFINDPVLEKRLKNKIEPYI
jgi:predicted protein tyrosine phosphatase